MDNEDKHLVKKIKNSVNSGMAIPEVIRKMQNKGYKLEYIDALVNKANSKKASVIVVWVVILVLILGCCGVVTYVILKPSRVTVQERKISKPILTNTENISNIKITPEYITYLLQEMGAFKLHKHPLTKEKAIISINIDEQYFYAIIDRDIETYKGLETGDIKVTTTKQEAIDAISAENSQQYLKDSVAKETMQVEIIEESKATLFAKGYLDFANSLGFSP